MSESPVMRSILHIDDDEEIREIVALTLTRLAGLDVRSAASGDAGLALACQNPPDLILMDFMMPGRDGLQVLQDLRKRQETRDIPVAFLTAHADDEIRARMLALGAAGVIDKPFRAADLAARLRASWASHRAGRG